MAAKLGLIGRQSIKSTIYIYLGVAVGFLLRAKLFPEYLTESQIGILALLVSYSSIYAQISLLGFNQAVIKYFPFFRNPRRGHHGFLLLYLLVALAGFGLFLIIQYLVGQFQLSDSQFREYYHLCIPLTGALLVFMVMDNYNTVLYNATTGILLREFVLRVAMLGGFLFFIQEVIDFDQYAWYYVGCYILIALLMVIFIIWRGELRLKPTHRLWNRTIAKAMVGISFFGLITGLNNIMILQVNNILIDIYYDAALTGIYVTNFFFATLILLPSRGLNKIAPTVISNAFKSRDLPTIHRVHFKSVTNQMVIGVLLFVGLIINLDNIYRILPESFAVGQYVIIFTGLAYVIQMMGGVSSAIIAFSDHYRYNTYYSALQLAVLVVLNLWLLPNWGITGAALATLGSILVLNVAKFIFLKVKFGIQPYKAIHLWGLLIGVLCVFINFFIPNQTHLLADILLRSTLITAVYVGLTYLLKISQEMNNAINKTFEKLRIR